MIRARALMYLEGMKTGGAAPADISTVAKAFLALAVIYEAEADGFLEPKDRRKRNVPGFLKASVMSSEKRVRGERRRT